jgi:uncharacterized protein YecE (DUF72 family)
MAELAEPPGRAVTGTSGWRYREWRGDYYPGGLRQKDELRYVAERLASVELNGSFYSLQRPESYRRWADATPPGFVFAVKGSRFISHLLALRNTGIALANFFASGVLALDAKLGPILWQLPPRTRFDADVLERFLAQLPRDTAQALALARGHDERVDGRAHLEIDAIRPLRYALEPRHESFGDGTALEILRRHDVALVEADTAGTWPHFRESTATFRYLRLHGSRELYAGGYLDDELDAWAATIRAYQGAGQDVYTYFDNDIDGRAPFDAERLAARLGR